MLDKPLVAAFRFLLELAAIFIYGFWGWRENSGFLRYIIAFGLPLLAASVWGIFRVPGDPGDAPISVPGFIRLMIEVVIFGTASWLLVDTGFRTPGIIFALAVLVQYVLTFKRLQWLMRQ